MPPPKHAAFSGGTAAKEFLFLGEASLTANRAASRIRYAAAPIKTALFKTSHT